MFWSLQEQLLILRLLSPCLLVSSSVNETSTGTPFMELWVNWDNSSKNTQYIAIGKSWLLLLLLFNYNNHYDPSFSSRQKATSAQVGPPERGVVVDLLRIRVYKSATFSRVKTRLGKSGPASQSCPPFSSVFS